MRVLMVNGNKIEMDFVSLFSGKETVYYNGEVVSRKNSIFGTVHTFRVKENDADVQYDIQTGFSFVRPGVVIKRNGELIYADNDLKNPRGMQW